MALTANTVPSTLVDYAVPYDAMNVLASAQTLVATGYMGSPNQLDLGSSAPVSAAGRTDGIWSVDITAVDMTSGDETYRLHLMGSNDAAWGNGNVELLAFHDLAAATAGRIVPTILGASPAIPPTGRAGTILRIPFTNLRQNILYRYVRGYVVIGGTTPTITFTSWLSKATVSF
jgi:hypothetical protein